MSETQCPKCSMPWCDHVGDGHDEPTCPTKPEHRCPSCERDALRDENERLKDAIEIEREGQRSMARALGEIHRLSDLNVAIALSTPPPSRPLLLDLGEGQERPSAGRVEGGVIVYREKETDRG